MEKKIPSVEERKVEVRDGKVYSEWSVKEVFSLDKGREIAQMLGNQASQLQVQMQNDKKQLEKFQSEFVKSRISRKEIKRAQTIAKFANMLGQMEQLEAKLKIAKEQLEKVQKDRLQLEKELRNDK